MRSFFQYMAGTAARWIRGIIGFVLIAWGYSSYQYPANIILISIGTLVLLLAIFNISILAPLFGFTPLGNKLVGKYGEINGVPGEDPTGIDPATPNLKKVKNEKKDYEVKGPQSTTQGGSDFGQGSMHLGPASYKQGSVETDGSNYENEQKLDKNDTQ